VCSANGPAAGAICNGIQPADVGQRGDVTEEEVNSDMSGTSARECDSFCDFVRFEGTVTEDSARRADVASSRSAGYDAGGGTLLRASIDSYKQLFEAVVVARILHDSQSLTDSFMDQFITPNTHKLKTVSPSRVRSVDRVELVGPTQSLIDVFSVSCQLLVDFSALPIYTESSVSSPAANSCGKKF